MVGVIVILAVIAVIVVLGIVFLTGRGTGLIVGKTVEEGEQVDSKKLGKFMGKVLMLAAVCMVPILLNLLLDMRWLFYVGLVALVIVFVFVIIYMNTRDRFGSGSDIEEE